MYYHLTSHCRICYFQKDLILLDLRKNQLVILNPDIKEKLLKVLIEDFARNADKENLKDIIDLLQQKKIITQTLYQSPEKLPPADSLPGANIDWRIERSSLDQPVPMKMKLKAFYHLSIVYLTLNLLGFYSLIKLVRRNKKKLKSSSQDSRLLPTLIDALNQACLYFPIRVKCLEWAVSLTLMAIKSGIDCQFSIGVQSKPFSAHAWAEYKGEVLYDNSLLRTHLPIILTEP